MCFYELCNGAMTLVRFIFNFFLNIFVRLKSFITRQPTEPIYEVFVPPDEQPTVIVHQSTGNENLNYNPSEPRYTGVLSPRLRSPSRSTETKPSPRCSSPTDRQGLIAVSNSKTINEYLNYNSIDPQSTGILEPKLQSPVMSTPSKPNPRGYTLSDQERLINAHFFKRNEDLHYDAIDPRPDSDPKQLEKNEDLHYNAIDPRTDPDPKMLEEKKDLHYNAIDPRTDPDPKKLEKNEDLHYNAIDPRPDPDPKQLEKNEDLHYNAIDPRPDPDPKKFKKNEDFNYYPNDVRSTEILKTKFKSPIVWTETKPSPRCSSPKDQPCLIDVHKLKTNEDLNYNATDSSSTGILEPKLQSSILSAQSQLTHTGSIDALSDQERLINAHFFKRNEDLNYNATDSASTGILEPKLLLSTQSQLSHTCSTDALSDQERLIDNYFFKRNEDLNCNATDHQSEPDPKKMKKNEDLNYNSNDAPYTGIVKPRLESLITSTQSKPNPRDSSATDQSIFAQMLKENEDLNCNSTDPRSTRIVKPKLEPPHTSTQKKSRRKDSVSTDQTLIDAHKLLIDEVLQEMNDIVQEMDFSPTDPRYIGILRAKNEQLEELENQLRVFEEVMSRARDYNLRKRESYRFSGRLPAFGKRSEIDEYIENFDATNRFLIVQGQTGSGKSTQLPQYIADHPRMSGKKVVCTQPRKIAAISLAERVSVEYSCGSKKSRIGFPVGYSVGGSRAKVHKGRTRIEFMTEGRMLERLMNRREEDFNDIGAIIIDEAHERSIVCDILLGTLKKIDPLWNDILIVVSSATIDLVAFSKFFNNRAKIIEIAGRMYPVQRIYRPLPEVLSIQARGTGNLADQGDIVKAVVETALEIHECAETNSGDILCFLPGVDEVHRATSLFENKIKPKMNKTELLTAQVYELNGAQDADEQRKVFEELDSNVYRKVIFATMIAETSITINGVVYVIDSGVKKEMTFDPKRNISSLKIINISQSSSLQREGRAGRTQPGVCYKLYSEEDFQNMSVNTLPQIFRRPLPLAILFLRKMGVNPIDFDWISAPDVEAIKSAEEELVILGAIEATSKIPTPLGGLISISQQEPKLVRMIYTGMLNGNGTIAIKMAALLSVAGSFFYDGGKDADSETKSKLIEKRRLLQHKDGDILTLLQLYTQYELLSGTEKDNKQMQKVRTKWILDNSLSRKAFRTAESTIRDLKYIFSCTPFWKEKESQDLIPNDGDILRLYCSGYFLHAARRVNIKGKDQNRLNYFAIEPEVLGGLSFKASLAQEADGDSNRVPEWILFGQILKFPEVTIFPSGNLIDFNWIQNESEDFYNKCIVKQNKLPTEVVEIKTSDTIIRTIFGRRLVNLPYLEEELNCSIKAEIFSGLLRAFCSKILFTSVENFLKAEVERAKEVINNETLEVTWKCNTRLVIGPGYEITSILFPREFNTLYIRNLERNCTRKGFESFIYSIIDNRDKVSSIQLISYERDSMGIVKLNKFSDAALLLNELKDGLSAIGGDLNVAPHMGEVSTGSIPKAEDVRFKISWPLGFSNGVATIILETWEEGNQVVDLFPNLFHRTIANAFGESRSTGLTSNKAITYRGPGRRYRFSEYNDNMMQPIYKVKVKFLDEDIDEFDIIERLKSHSITPLRVTIEREISEYPVVMSMLAEEREEKLALFRATCIGFKEAEVTATDFFDKFSCRAGVYIYHPDTAAMEKVFRQLREEYSNITEYGQSYRVELERLFTFSVHVDLYKCLKSKFKKTLKEIRTWGVWASETGPETGNKKNQAFEKNLKFVYIRLRHSDVEMILRCRQKLETILERVSLNAQCSPNIGNLFTWTGRSLVQERIPSSTDYYVHWDNPNQQVHVYGKESFHKNEIIRRLNVIIELIQKWKEADCFEEALMLDRRALETVQRNNKADIIDIICQKFNFVKGQYHLFGRNKLVISIGSKNELEKFKRVLEARGLKMLKPRKKSFGTWECGVCLCEVDSKFMVTSICNHAFCMVCIQQMFASAAGGAGVQKMPLCCPTDQCELRLPVQDIMKAVPPQAIPKLNETALDMYIETNDGSAVKLCPKPGCNQIFRPNKTGSEDPTFYACDNCLTDFCLECTETLKKEMRAHRGQRCEDVQISEDAKIRKLMNQIRDEILNLSCPRCKKAFYDYDGCAALSCEKCHAAFCALCLADCGEDAHGHVMRCRYNTTNGLHVDQASVEKANRLYRIDKISEFIRNASDLETDLKIKLLNALSRDLSDLCIKVTDIQLN